MATQTTDGQTGKKKKRPAGSPNERSPAEENYDAAFERAEELVDRAADNLIYYGARLQRQIQKLVARAGEEAEDIWAEAQEIRRRNGTS